MRKILAAAIGLTLLGAGCVPLPQPTHEIFIPPTPPTTTFPVASDEQIACANTAAQFFNQHVVYSPTSAYRFKSNWNAQQKKCFVTITTNLTRKDLPETLREIDDAAAGALYGTFGVIRNVPRAQQKPFLCELHTGGSKKVTRHCKTETEFDVYIDALMSS